EGAGPPLALLGEGPTERAPLELGAECAGHVLVLQRGRGIRLFVENEKDLDGLARMQQQGGLAHGQRKSGPCRRSCSRWIGQKSCPQMEQYCFLARGSRQPLSLCLASVSRALGWPVAQSPMCAAMRAAMTPS